MNVWTSVIVCTKWKRKLAYIVICKAVHMPKHHSMKMNRRNGNTEPKISDLDNRWRSDQLHTSGVLITGESS
jgi:hypothetical protein